MGSKFVSEIKNISKEILEENNTFDSDNIYKAIEWLDSLFERWEDKIRDEKQRPFLTDIVENQFSVFAVACAELIVDNLEELSSVSDEMFTKLFRHRHLGYGFYVSYDKTKKIINRKPEYETIIYHSLACYFDKFTGKFYDNEQAIKMLCKYYPEGGVPEEIKERVVSALYTHINLAGTPSDTGFAYNGITIIKEEIGKLPIEIVKGILYEYEIYKVLNNKVYRNQIFTIINSSKIEEKAELKFFFIDSVLLIDSMSSILYRIEKAKVNGIKHRSWGFKKCADNELKVWDNDNKTLRCLWSYDNFSQRKLNLGTKTIAKIKYDILKNEIIIIYHSSLPLIIPFDNKDWILNEYFSKKFDEELLDFFILNITEYKKLLFSHIWIDNYRGVKSQQLSFDHSFKVTKSSGIVKLVKSTDKTPLTKEFFGESIYSISAIVGRNGTGKTSTIDFLRDEFFKLIYLINEDYIKIKNGIIIKDDYYLENDYVFIFKIEAQLYFITNAERIEYNQNEVLPYSPQLLDNESETSKMVYFSSMINSDVTGETIKKENSRNKKEQMNELLKSIDNKGYIDFSENKSFKENNADYLQYNKIQNNKYNKKSEDYDILKNKNFWYQVAFLDAHSNEQLSEWFGDNFKVRELIIQNVNGNYENTSNISILNGNSTSIIDNVLKINEDSLKKSILKVNHFSSGQYAKFSFLSKLYWCLNGYEHYHERIEKILGKDLFDITDTITNNSTAVIFIDEGELYYHPEWQRTYLSTLINLIEKYTKDKNITLQIVITSNSPFIISDIPTTNIMFLPDGLPENQTLTFGSNIHSMLRNGFFMQSTIGEFAKEKIVSTFTKLKDIKNSREKSSYFMEKESLKSIINILGDDLLRSKLSELYYECFPDEAGTDLVLNHNKLTISESEKNNALYSIDDIENLKSALKSFLTSIDKIEGEKNDKN